MYETPYVGRALTVGNLGKISEIAAEAAALAKSAKLALDDIGARIERLEKQSRDDATTRAAVR